jgi:hypothetical protein
MALMMRVAEKMRLMKRELQVENLPGRRPANQRARYLFLLGHVSFFAHSYLLMNFDGNMCDEQA